MAEIRVVMVVGMHRAGTSALMRGLTALGIEIGDNLLPPSAENPKGYWEDKALVDIDDHLLSSVGHDWQSYGLLGLEPAALLKTHPLFFEVVQRIRDYTSRHPIWGFKDPRSARLLPFWQAVLQHLALPTGYVIALRNPLSVARSLASRNGFAPQKSHLMWLEHYACAFKYTRGYPVVVVDYDRLIEEPLRELERVARRFGLSPDGAHDTAKEEYQAHFLEFGLRHTQFAPQDVFIAPDMFDHVTALYEWGYKLATDQISPDDADFCQCLAQIEDLYRGFVPALAYVQSLEVELQQVQLAHERTEGQRAWIQEACDRSGAEIVQLAETLTAQQQESGRLQAQVVELVEAQRQESGRLQAEIVQLAEALTAQQQESGRLQAQVVELVEALAAQQQESGRLQAQVVELVEALAAQQQESGRLQAQAEAQDRRIVDLQRTLAVEQGTVGQLQAIVTARNTHITRLDGALMAQRARARQTSRHIAALARNLHTLQTSTAWQLTRPLGKILTKNPRFARCLYTLLRLTWWTLTFRLPARLRASAHLRHYARVVEQAGLFDPAYYLAQNPDVAAAGLEPLRHYLECGAREGRQPHPLFDPAYYLAQNPDVAAAGVEPLRHYLAQDGPKDRQPHPLFDSRWYVTQHPEVLSTGLTPLEHYVCHSDAPGYDPHPLFDTAYYLSHNPDVAAAGLAPLRHYLEHGAQEDRQPHPLFDSRWYVTQHPEVLSTGLTPLEHYVCHSDAPGYDPHPLFDTAYYLSHNPDVAAAGLAPLRHYLEHGAQEGRQPHPLFDSRWYVTQHPEVLSTGRTPLEHYVCHSDAPGYDPHPLFDTAYYLSHNPDVVTAGLTPLQHYLEHGAQEGRQPHPSFDSRWYVTQHPEVLHTGLTPLEHYVRTQEDRQQQRVANFLDSNAPKEPSRSAAHHTGEGEVEHGAAMAVFTWYEGGR